MTSLEILAVYCPALYADPLVESHLTLARQGLSASFFGARYNEAVALLAAHRYYLNSIRGGESDVVTYKASGRMMQSNGGVGVIREELELTNYGMQLKALIRQMTAMASVSSSYVTGFVIGGT